MAITSVATGYLATVLSGVPHIVPLIEEMGRNIPIFVEVVRGRIPWENGSSDSPPMIR